MPLVGYIPFLATGDQPQNFLKKLGDVYGPVTGLFLGPTQPFIIVRGYEAVKEALLNDDLNGRMDSSIIRARSYGKRIG